MLTLNRSRKSMIEYILATFRKSHHLNSNEENLQLITIKGLYRWPTYRILIRKSDLELQRAAGVKLLCQAEYVCFRRP